MTSERKLLANNRSVYALCIVPEHRHNLHLTQVYLR